GNSAAVAPFPVSQSHLSTAQKSGHSFEPLLSRASLYSLIEHADRKGLKLDLTTLDEITCKETIICLDEWVEDCSSALAQFLIGVWSLIDIEAIVLDGGLPKPVLHRIINRTLHHVQDFHTEGIITCDVKLGEL
ncbi:MAG: hypothetical protein ACKVJ2_12910, partial [Pseudomonadales bacterium]